MKSKIKRKETTFDFITARMLIEIPKEGLVILKYIFNAILRLE